MRSFCSFSLAFKFAIFCMIVGILLGLYLGIHVYSGGHG